MTSTTTLPGIHCNFILFGLYIYNTHIHIHNSTYTYDHALRYILILYALSMARVLRQQIEYLLNGFRACVNCRDL